MTRRRRAGGSASPEDHTQVSEPELMGEAIDRARALTEGEPEGALTPMRITAMEQMVRTGVSIPVAATAIKCQRYVGPWAATAKRHMAAGQKPGFGPDESPYVLFLETMDSARAYSEAALVAAIYQAAPLDWRAALALLERRYSKRWHLQSKIELTAKSGQRVEIQTMSTEKLLQLAKGLLPEENIKVVQQLPSDIQDAEIVEDD